MTKIKQITNNFYSILFAHLFIVLLYSSQYFLGDILILLCMSVFCLLVFNKIYYTSMKWREIFLLHYLRRDGTFFNKLINFKLGTKIVAFFTAIVITVDFFIFFFNVNLFYDFIIFIDIYLMFFIVNKLHIPFKNEIHSNVYILFNQLFGNFINISVLFLIYLFYSLAFAEFTIHSRFESGILDPRIPVWIKEHITHSCYIFQSLLRANALIKLTIENIVSWNEKILFFYKVIQLFTMSFFPFLGITIFYRGLFEKFGDLHKSLLNYICEV